MSKKLTNSEYLNKEPSALELNRLWTVAIECEGIGGASSESLRNLYDARMQKFTWIGDIENDLRYSIDKYLEHRGYSMNSNFPYKHGDLL